MSKTAMPSPAAVAPFSGVAAGVGEQPQPSLSLVNSFRLAATVERLTCHILEPARHTESLEFSNLCLSLAWGIDYAVANNQRPPKSKELPSLVEQICQHKNAHFSQPAIMVLMISVKNASRNGWFSAEECQSLLHLANEIGSSFAVPGNTNSEPNNLVNSVSTVMSRFYPHLKMGSVLACLEVKESGYEAYMVDFYIPKKSSDSPQEKIHLFVAQTDDIGTSTCLISPQEVNFLINGSGVTPRTNILMDPGPQLPTNVTSMLKDGMNLLQAVGQFNGRYIVVVAFMSMLSSLDSAGLQDYIQSRDAVKDADSDIIEGPSRISLNCPISHTRIKNPVKGHLCKHLQCFDFSNFVDMNSRRPSWRCPHCNWHVCYTELCIDQNMVKVLKDVGDTVNEVIISSDGSWKAVLDNDDDQGRSHVKTSQSQESAAVMNSLLDLTKDDDVMDAVEAGETERKLDVNNLQHQHLTINSTKTSAFNDISGDNRNYPTEIEDNFWSDLPSILPPASSGVELDPQTISITSELTSANPVTSALTDALSPAPNQETELPGSTNLMNSEIQSQSLSMTANHEYGTLSPHYYRQVNRTPITVQALPAQPQTPTLQQISGTGPQYFSQSHMNTFPRPDVGLSSLRHYVASQAAAGTPAPNVPQSTFRVLPVFSTENHNLLKHQAPNLRMPLSSSQSPRFVQSSSPFSRTLAQQSREQLGVRNAAGNMSSQQARVMAAATQRTTRPTTQITTQSSSTPPQPVRVEMTVDLTSEGNWRPSGRMRGSLTGRAYEDAYRQFIIQPNQPAQPPRPQSNLTSSMSAAPVPPHLPVHPGNEPSSTNGGPGMGMP